MPCQRSPNWTETQPLTQSQSPPPAPGHNKGFSGQVRVIARQATEDSSLGSCPEDLALNVTMQ